MGYQDGLSFTPKGSEKLLDDFFYSFFGLQSFIRRII